MRLNPVGSSDVGIGIAGKGANTQIAPDIRICAQQEAIAVVFQCRGVGRSIGPLVAGKPFDPQFHAFPARDPVASCKGSIAGDAALLHQRGG